MQTHTSIPFRMDERQRRMHEWLALVGPGSAQFYQDACRLMATEPPFETATHMIGHCLREIESALRDVLKPVALRLNLVWIETFHSDQSLGKKKKKTAPQLSHEEEIRFILDTLHITETDPVAKMWLRIALQTDDFGLAHYAHRHNLTEARPMTNDFRQFWSEMNEVFHRVLDAFASCYLETHELIDTNLLDATRSLEDKIKFLTLNVPHNFFSLDYFFRRIGERQETEWLLPLRKKGYFREPPPPALLQIELNLPQWE